MADVALVMGFIFVCLFGFVLQMLDCCAERRMSGAFLIFLSHSSYFTNRVNL